MNFIRRVRGRWKEIDEPALELDLRLLCCVYMEAVFFVDGRFVIIVRVALAFILISHDELRIRIGE